MTTFSKKKIDLLTPPQGSSVCARKEYVLKGSIMRKTMNIVFYSYKAYYWKLIETWMMKREVLELKAQKHHRSFIYQICKQYLKNCLF